MYGDSYGGYGGFGGGYNDPQMQMMRQAMAEQHQYERMVQQQERMIEQQQRQMMKQQTQMMRQQRSMCITASNNVIKYFVSNTKVNDNNIITRMLGELLQMEGNTPEEFQAKMQGINAVKIDISESAPLQRMIHPCKTSGQLEQLELQPYGYTFFVYNNTIEGEMMQNIKACSCVPNNEQATLNNLVANGVVQQNMLQVQFHRCPKCNSLYIIDYKQQLEMY